MSAHFTFPPLPSLTALPLLTLGALGLSSCQKEVTSAPANRVEAAEPMLTQHYRLPASVSRTGARALKLSREELQQAGIDFDTNAEIDRHGPTGLIMRNTCDNQQRLERLLDQTYGPTWSREDS